MSVAENSPRDPEKWNGERKKGRQSYRFEKPENNGAFPGPWIFR